MSLISDAEYLIHQLRLTYLRNVDDPYGPRIITLDKAHNNNAYIVASGLGDLEKWPELSVPDSPTLEHEDPFHGHDGSTKRAPLRDTHSAAGYPAARGLNYTKTIMGHRSGGAGMRVTGEKSSRYSRKDRPRASSNQEPPLPPIPVDQDATPQATPHRTRADSAPLPVVNGHTHHASTSTLGSVDASPPSEKRRSMSTFMSLAEDPDESKGGSSEADTPINTVPTPVQPFNPPFARAAEMEARRKARMRKRAKMVEQDKMRQQAGGAPISFSDVESDEDEDVTATETESPDSDFGDPEAGGGSSDSDGEILDVTSPSVVEGTSLLSAESLSTPLSPEVIGGSSPNPTTSPQTPRKKVRSNTRSGSRTRTRNTSKRRSLRNSKHLDGSFMDLASTPSPDVEAPVNSISNGDLPSQSSNERVRPPTHFPAIEAVTRPSRPVTLILKPKRQTHAKPPPINQPLSFEPSSIGPKSKPKRSLLTSLLAASSSQADNPFSTLYASVAARSDAYPITVFFPHSKTPSRPMELNVQRDASVEEVIGFALWTYWEDSWNPRLDDDIDMKKVLAGVKEEEEREKIKLSPVGYNMRIAEDDGEVDEDFPPLDRGKKISTFNFGAYAVVIEASPQQIAKNNEYDVKIVRRPSRIRGQSSSKLNVVGSTSVSTLPSTFDNGFSSSALATSDFSMGQTLGPSPHQGPSVYLRVRVEDPKMQMVHVSTTIQVPAGTYMAEAFEMVCKKQKIDNPKDWAMMLKDPKIHIPLDRTVASLQGRTEVLLVRKAQYPEETGKAGKTTDPNASILKRMSELPDEQNKDDFTAAYKKFNVTRKLPVLGHNGRTLAIDGEYIHIMPAGTKGGFLESSKTASYHIRSVISCAQQRDSAGFKLVVRRREGQSKRYDFDGESPKQAGEIVQAIRSLQKVFKMERTSTMSKSKSRRSRQIVA